MTRYLVFDTEAAAAAADDKISDRARTVYAAQGYQVDGDDVLGKDAVTGETNPDAVTTHWADPRQRLDGKWVIPHPEAHPAADVVIDNKGTTVVQFVMQDLTTATVEEEDVSWWPAPVDPPAA